MIRPFVIAILASILSACGGGGSEAPIPVQAVAVVPTPPAKPACVPKVVSIALLGDSTMHGSDSNYAEVQTIWPAARLQANMDAMFGVGSTIVTDYSVPGSNSAQAPMVDADIKGANFMLNDERCRVNGAACDTAALFQARMAALHLTFVVTGSPLVNPADYDQEGYVAADFALGVPVADVYHYVLGIANWQDHFADGVHDDSWMYGQTTDNVITPIVAKQVAPLRCM